MSYKIGDIVMKCKPIAYVVHEDAFNSENTHCSKGNVSWNVKCIFQIIRQNIWNKALARHKTVDNFFLMQCSYN